MPYFPYWDSYPGTTWASNNTDFDLTTCQCGAQSQHRVANCRPASPDDIDDLPFD